MRDEDSTNYEKAAVFEMSVQSSPVLICNTTLCTYSNLFNLIKGNDGISIFTNISVGTSTTAILSKVDKYLNYPVNNILNPLKWWSDNC